MPTTKLILTDLEANSNKFWTADLDETTDTVTFTWGRVGEAGQSTVKADGRKLYERKIREKLGKGYTHQATVGSSTAAVGNLKKIAHDQIKHDGDTETKALIDFLVKRNIHKIEGATTMKWDASTGQFTTPLGPVTEDGLDKAQGILTRIGECVAERKCTDADFTRLVNGYLRIVPQHIGRRRLEARDIFPDAKAVRRQQELLDALRSVVRTATAAAVKDAPDVFKTELHAVPETDPEFKRIAALFAKTSRGGHVSARLQLKKVWKVEVAGAEAAFQRDGAKVGNVQELWHGTKDTNLLSLLKSGYVIPKHGGSFKITGRAYGDGVYFSDISTKSLNYATDFWGGGSSKRCFMILNDVAMGKAGNPASRGYGTRYPIPGTDSTFAKGGASGGFINNEMVVYRTSQIRPKYLCEFA